MPELLAKGFGWVALAAILTLLWLAWMNRDKLPKIAPASATTHPTPVAPATGHGAVAHAGDDHEDEEADEAHAPPAPHPPAPAGGHGHDSHGGASGALGWLLLAIVFGVLALAYVGKKAGFWVIPGVGGYGRDAGAHAPADYSSHQDGVSLDWNPVTAPMSNWLTLNGKAGYDIVVCVPTTNPTCAVDVPVIGFRMRCVLMDGVTEVDWNTSGSCRDYLRLKLQSTGNKPLPMNFRYVRRK